MRIVTIIDRKNMFRTTTFITTLIFSCFFLPSCGSTPDSLPKSEWIYPDTNGKLVYKKDERGNRIIDFSHAGYMGGGVALPDVAVKVTVQPPTDPETDCTAMIQEAIDRVSVMPPDDNGLRGAVLLMPGRYRCSNTIRITTDGVTLRGSGKAEKNLPGKPLPPGGGWHPGAFLPG